MYSRNVCPKKPHPTFDSWLREGTCCPVEGLSKSYGERQLFADLTFGVQEGERVALWQEMAQESPPCSGAICGQEPADSGRVVFSSGVRHGHLRQELDVWRRS